MSGLFEGLPLLPDSTVRFELDQFPSERASVIGSVLITGQTLTVRVHGQFIR